MDNKLKRGQIVFVNNERYVVHGMIEFEEEGSVWHEYKLSAGPNKNLWLNIEENDYGVIEYSIYKMNYQIKNYRDKMEINYNDVNYSLYESGEAKVKSYFGPMDVDLYERCKYFEYKSDDNKRISIENWSGEIEKSTGEIIDPSQINITDEMDETLTQSIGSIKIWEQVFMVLIVVPVIISIVIAFLGVVAGGSKIRRGLDKSPSFKYLTSVTSNENNKKARVYTTSLTISAAVDEIIKMNPEGIVSLKQDDETDADTEKISNTVTTSTINYTPTYPIINVPSVPDWKSEYNTILNDITNSSSTSSYKMSDYTYDDDIYDYDIIEDDDESVSDEDIGVGITTKSEYAYVYKDEDGEVCVQVSALKFVTSSSRAYRAHSRYRSHYYSSLSNDSKVSKRYSRTLSSARQSSIASRKSSGGGLSSGK